MNIRTGDMWDAYDEADLFLFTANSTLNKQGELVMGLGMAKQVKEKMPSVPKKMGDVVSHICGSRGDYYLLVSKHWPKQKLGAFQVKRDWRSVADMNVMKFSTNALYWWALAHRDASIHINFPGIGSGRLTESKVMPLIENLPDNVNVWKYE